MEDDRINSSVPLAPEERADLLARVERNGALSVDVDVAVDGFLDLHYHFPKVKFDRIRRITGYLTGDLRTWNDAKRAEEHDRVKHGVTECGCGCGMKYPCPSRYPCEVSDVEYPCEAADTGDGS